ncbi:MAG: hypothetical protein HZC17_08320 [Candidatus Omnitrophica bacterium]|nr:hypothetical protein [Candidatus Omnitrophota bacterium]
MKKYFILAVILITAMSSPLLAQKADDTRDGLVNPDADQTTLKSRVSELESTNRDLTNKVDDLEDRVTDIEDRLSRS